MLLGCPLLSSRLGKTGAVVGAEYVVTLRGEPVAVLRPLTEEETQRLRQVEIDTALAEMKALAQEVASAWTSEKSGVELIAEQRR